MEQIGVSCKASAFLSWPIFNESGLRWPTETPLRRPRCRYIEDAWTIASVPFDLAAPPLLELSCRRNGDSMLLIAGHGAEAETTPSFEARVSKVLDCDTSTLRGEAMAPLSRRVTCC